MNGTTPLPPWAPPDATPGRGRRRRDLPAPLREALRRAPEDLETLALSAWLAVLSRCAGEPEVGTAVVDAAGRLGRVTAAVHDTSWADLAAGLRRAPLRDGRRPHSALDVHGTAPPGTADLLIRLDAGAVRVEHDTARVSDRAAERVLGYLVHALSVAVAAPAAQVDLGDMLSAEERHHQLTALCGPSVDNGPDGFVPAFRARVAAHPDRPAIRHREETLTYADLDRASARVARCLRGLAGRAVAVVTERHPGWVAAMLGVLKAGAVYLPVRPDLPAARVADALAAAGCDLALTDASGGRLVAAVAEARWGGTVLALDELAEAEPVGPVEPVEPAPPALRQPAYICFTSGSTGRPTGAVCEHAGMMNHLLSKVDAHGLGPGDVVAQTAAQCFDISLWQVCAPLLVGGQSVIVDTDRQLDLAAFAAALARHRVTTVQMVPSYLEVLLAHLEAGAVRLPRLATVSVTGEALKADLVRRWFAVMPDTRLVNAYGATETSDGTMQEVLDGPPARVTVGRPVRNARVYVVDDRLRLMPEGAPGEIVFAGVCVGRGYVGDAGRTAAAFGADPYRPGERLYRTGELGRWLPDGRLEFLGRRDDRVLIRGRRVALGEVRAALLRVPGVSAAAVLPVGEGNAARLVGFYVSEYELSSVDLHDLLSARLPRYMVPAHHVRLPALPTDERRLAALAEDLAAGSQPFEPPVSEAEQRLATVWAEVLGMAAGRVGRHDNFFDLGGTSLSAIHLLMRLGHRLSLADLVTRPVLKDQARLLAAAGGAGRALLLHELGGAGLARPVLVCFPDAGGNAINFQHLADTVAERVRVLAVEPPGHDLARPDDDLVAVPRLAERLARELGGTPAPYLWGQGAGAAAALATARALERAGTAVAAILVAWDDTVPSGPAEHLTDDEVADQLRRRRAYVEVDGAAPGRLAFVARAYRHDWAEVLRMLDLLGGDPGVHCPVVEFTLGAASGRLRAATRRRLAGVDGDLARHRPGEILGALDLSRGRVVAVPA